MEDLFWTTLSLNGKEAEYHIIFENDAYCFIPKDVSLVKYKFKRGHDEWQAMDAASENVKDAAVEALEKYLMRQH
jgi:hypothetical protein